MRQEGEAHWLPYPPRLRLFPSIVRASWVWGLESNTFSTSCWNHLTLLFSWSKHTSCWWFRIRFVLESKDIRQFYVQIFRAFTFVCRPEFLVLWHFNNGSKLVSRFIPSHIIFVIDRVTDSGLPVQSFTTKSSYGARNVTWWALGLDSLFLSSEWPKNWSHNAGSILTGVWVTIAPVAVEDESSSKKIVEEK